jgi:integrase/recombinase XerD
VLIEDKGFGDDKVLQVFKTKNLTKSLRKVNTVKYLDYELVMGVINEIDNLRDRMLLTFLLNTGLRITEAISIKKGQVDISSSTITVVWLKKRKKQDRVIPVNDKLKAVLVYYLAGLNKEDRLFDISRQRAYDVCKRWLGVSPHVLRHSFAVHYRKSGGRLEDLSALLGHSSLQMTLIYSSITQEELKDEVNKIKW